MKSKNPLNVVLEKEKSTLIVRLKMKKFR